MVIGTTGAARPSSRLVKMALALLAVKCWPLIWGFGVVASWKARSLLGLLPPPPGQMTHVAHVVSRVVRHSVRRLSNATMRKSLAFKMQLTARLNSAKFAYPMAVLPGTPGHVYASRHHPPGRRDRWGPGDIVVVFIHGGGFHLMGPQYQDDANMDVLRTLERATERVTSASLVCVEYPLAPRDCWFSSERGGSSQAIDAAADAIKWLHREWGVPIGNLIVSGDSAGGNLALTASAQLVREGFFTPTRAPRCLVL
jgi:acetyl esterase/lipase